MKILTMAWKDLLRSLRSAFFLGMAVAAPLLLTGLMYFAFSGIAGENGEMPALKVGVVNLDTLSPDSPLQEPLGNTIRSVFFDESVRSWISAVDYPSAASARQAVDRREAGVAVIIPPGFSAGFLAGDPQAVITLVQDPTLSLTPQVVRSILVSLLDGFSGGKIAYQTLTERHMALGLSVEPARVMPLLNDYQAWYTAFERDLFHHSKQAALRLQAQGTSTPQQAGGLAGLMKFVMAGQMIFFAFFTGGYAMMSILQEEEEGTLARLFSMPVSRVTILAGKFLAVVLTVALQGLVLMVASHYAFQINWGNPQSALLAFLGQVAAASGLGVLLISFIRSTRQGGPVLGGVLAGLGMLGGLFTVAVPSAAELFEKISVVTPQGWVLATWRAVLNAEPPAQVLVPFSVCLAFGLVTFGIGTASFCRRFAQITR